MSVVGDLPDSSIEPGYISIDTDITNHFVKDNLLDFVIVESEELYREKGARTYVEVPVESIDAVYSRYWSNAWPGYTIQGYQLPARRIDILKDWNLQERDQHLFRRVIDETRILFYTFPAENRHFVFLTNKFDYDQLDRMINLDNLKGMAKEICNLKSGKSC